MSMERSLGFVAVQSRGGIITIPAEARRMLRLDAPGAQVEVILRDNDLVLIPHVAVPLRDMRDGAPGDGEPPADPAQAGREVTAQAGREATAQAGEATAQARSRDSRSR